MAFATGAVKKFASPLSLTDVLGKYLNVGDYIGSMAEDLTAFPGELHRIAIFVDQTARYLLAD